ncbi:hypothetical protein QO010_000706 [Caulobacter ginsengisoli]|uniref:Phasin domain-containing protein n=1 Tax=Caulobacter ginsengisoli TaxID=400775 RepID=A0ABU0IP57_9CAUL|nr:hypothetical protein [Caulobacter ginsengisoli]MDQ0462958.1 hypothetical protein [Caulobacter ginsengisoli]
MEQFDDGMGGLLSAARERGAQAMGATVLPAGLDQFTVYAGLIGSALDLGKLLATEQRDLQVIGSHHQIEAARIDAAFREVEAAMVADFQRDAGLRQKTFDAIDQLIAAGQYEIASEFHRRLFEGFQRGALESIIGHRNVAAAAASSRMFVK